MPVGWYVRLQLREERSVGQHTAVARTVLTRWREGGVLSFRASGSWLRLVATGERRLLGGLVRDTKLSLFQQRRLGFHPAIYEPVRDQWHLSNLFHVVLRTGDPDADPFHDGSNLPDLLGLRVLGRYTARHVRERLPRVSRVELLRYLGVVELNDDGFSMDHLVRATAAAAGLEHLEGKDRETHRACVALVAASHAELTSLQLARLIHRSPRTIRRLRTMEPDAELTRAIRLQMSLRRGR